MLGIPRLKRFEICAASVFILYILFFIFWFIRSNNREFSFYALGILILFFFFLYNARRMNLSPFVLWGFVILGFLHLFGGAIHIFGVRLYDLMSLNLIDLGGEFVLIKYDQIIHFFSTFFVFLALSEIYNEYFGKEKVKNKQQDFKKIYLVFLFAAFGISCMNEIIEFFPAYFWDDHGVGGYVNTILDLCANFLGSLFGMVWLSISSRNK